MNEDSHKPIFAGGMTMQKNGAATAGKTEPPPSADLREYAAQTIQERLQKMLSLVDDVRRSEEIEPVHKMRVASRRTRAALDIFDVAFSGGDYARLEREVKKITGVLSEARDLDVMQAKLADHLLELPQEQRAGLQSLIDQLREQRERAQKTVDRALRRVESYDLEACFKSVMAKNNRGEANSRPWQDASKDDSSSASPHSASAKPQTAKPQRGGNGHG
jgi:CHAD domain-containing protein